MPDTVRSTRKVLAGLLRKHGDRLDEETFRTLMCEVESVINSRRLTTVSSNPKDLDPLTPNQVLTGKPRVCLHRVTSSELMSICAVAGAGFSTLLICFGGDGKKSTW